LTEHSGFCGMVSKADVRSKLTENSGFCGTVSKAVICSPCVQLRSPQTSADQFWL